MHLCAKHATLLLQPGEFLAIIVSSHKDIGALQGIDAQLAGSGLIIKKTAVRGVDSFGMLCSAHDIGWSDEADGVLFEMPGSAEPGDPCPADPPKVNMQACKCKL